MTIQSLSLDQVKALRDGDYVRCLIPVSGEDQNGREHDLPAGLGAVVSNFRDLGPKQGFGFDIVFIVPGAVDEDYPARTSDPTCTIVNTFDQGDDPAFPIEPLTDDEISIYKADLAAMKAAMTTGKPDPIGDVIAALRSGASADIWYDAAAHSREEGDADDLTAKQIVGVQIAMEGAADILAGIRDLFATTPGWRAHDDAYDPADLLAEIAGLVGEPLN